MSKELHPAVEVLRKAGESDEAVLARSVKASRAVLHARGRDDEADDVVVRTALDRGALANDGDAVARPDHEDGIVAKEVRR